MESPYPISNHPDHNPNWRKVLEPTPTLDPKKNPNAKGAAQPAPKKKTKLLLTILIPAVILLFLIGGGVAAYFIWWHGKDKVEPPKQEKVEDTIQPKSKLVDSLKLLTDSLKVVNEKKNPK